MVRKYTKKHSSYKRVKTRKKHVKKHVKKKVKKQRKKKMTRIKTRRKTQKGKGKQKLLQMDRKTQSKKQAIFSEQETRAINKFRLGTVEYHKGPIEIFLKKERIPISSERLKDINPMYKQDLEDLDEDYSLINDADSGIINGTMIDDKIKLFEEQNASKYIWYGIARGHGKVNKKTKDQGYIIRGSVELSRNFNLINIESICKMERGGSKDLNKLIIYLMSGEDTDGQKLWKYLVSPVSSEMISNTMSDMNGEDGEFDINGYKYEIKLLDIIFKYSDLPNESFKDFKERLLSEPIDLENKEFITNWFNITNMINNHHEEELSEDDLLTGESEDDLLRGEHKHHVDKLQKLIEYLNSNKFKSDQDFTLLFNHLDTLTGDDTASDKFVEKMEQLSTFENTANDPEGIFNIKTDVLELEISIFQKWFDENSSLFNEYLYTTNNTTNNTINKLGSCPRIKYCDKNNEESKCNIYPQKLKPDVFDELTGKAKILYNDPDDEFL